MACLGVKPLYVWRRRFHCIDLRCEGIDSAGGWDGTVSEALKLPELRLH